MPELFPTKISATAQTTYYNGARIATKISPLITGFLIGAFDGNYAKDAAAVMLIYITGIVVLLFAPETKGKTPPD